MSAVLVTGGSRGIGRAICLAFARGGSDVYFCYSADESGAEETLKLLRDTGVGAQAFRCDVTKEDQVLEMFGQTMGIDVLVNNAGISRFGLIQDTSLQEWNDALEYLLGQSQQLTAEAARDALLIGLKVQNKPKRDCHGEPTENQVAAAVFADCTASTSSLR